MIEYILIATLYHNMKPHEVKIRFDDQNQCVEAVKAIAQTNEQIEDLRCVIKRK
jgi:hypothetical protein